jgi:hypothetical protein
VHCTGVGYGVERLLRSQPCAARAACGTRSPGSLGIQVPGAEITGRPGPEATEPSPGRPSLRRRPGRRPANQAKPGPGLVGLPGGRPNLGVRPACHRRARPANSAQARLPASQSSPAHVLAWLARGRDRVKPRYWLGWAGPAGGQPVKPSPGAVLGLVGLGRRWPPASRCKPRCCAWLG